MRISSGEVAIAGEWDVREEFGRSTFCLVIFHKTKFDNTQLIYVCPFTSQKQNLQMFSIVRTDEVNGRQTWWVTWQVSLCHHFF